MLNFFLKSLDLDQETVEIFKKYFVFHSFLSIIKKQSIDFVEEMFEWAVGSDNIDDFKSQFFHRLIHSSKIEHLFFKLKEETPFSFLNEILKWFLKTNENKDE